MNTKSLPILFLQKKIFSTLLFIFCFVFASLSVKAQTTFYVNDASLLGDVITSAVGDDLNSGTSTSAPFATITKAMSMAANGDIIYIDAGTFPENVSVNKSVTIIGADSAKTILDKGNSNYSLSGGDGFTITVDNVSIQKLKLRNYNIGINVTVNISNLSIDKVSMLENFNAGVYTNKSINGFNLTNSILKNNGFKGNVNSGGSYRRGLLFQSSASDYTNIVITGNTVTDNSLVGIDINLNHYTNGINISNNTLARNGDDEIGVWLGNNNSSTSGAVLVHNNNITLSNAVRFGIEIKNPDGSGATSGIGSIVVSNNTINTVSHTGVSRDMGGIVVIRRKDGYAPPLLNNDQPKGVVILNNTINVENAHMNSDDAYGIVVGGTNHLIEDNTITNTEISIQLQKGNDNYNNNNSSNQANVDYYFSRDNSNDVCAYLDNNTITSSGAPRLVTGVATASATLPSIKAINTSTGIYFCSIQSAINDNLTVNGNTIEAQSGIHDGQVIINKEIILDGIDSATTTIEFTGTPTGVASLFTVTAKNVTIKNFKFKVDLVKTHSAITSSGNVSGLTIEGNTIRAAYTSGTPISYGRRNAININLAGTPNMTAVNSEPLIENVVIKANTIDTASGTGAVFFRSGISADRVRNLTVGGNVVADGNNFVSSVNHDVITRFYYGNQTIKNNSFNGGGVELSTSNGSGIMDVSNNTFNGVYSKLNKWHMLRVLNGSYGRTINITNNQFIDQNKSVTIENTKNVVLDNNQFTATVDGFRIVSINTKLRVNAASPSPLDTLGATLINNTFSAMGTFTTGNAIEFLNFDQQAENHYLLGNYVLGTAGNENILNYNIPRYIYVSNSNGENTQNPSFYNIYTEYNDGGLAAATTTGYWTKDIYANNNYYYVNGSLKLPSSFTPSDYTTLPSFIFDKEDDANIGRVIFSGITSTDPIATYFTIQAAVDGSNAGATISIPPGIYAENVTVNKSLTIVGTDSSNTILDKGDGNYSATGGNGFTITADNVSISKLKIRNYNLGISNTVDVTGIFIDEVSLLENYNAGFYTNKSINVFSLTNSILKHNGFKGNVNSGGSYRRGLLFQSSASDYTNIVITGNTVTDNSLVGLDINLNNYTNGINISNNILARNGDAEMGLWLGRNADTTSAAVIINNNNITLSNAVRFGIEIKNPLGTGKTSGAGSIVVSNNTINTVSHLGASRDMGGIVVIRRKDNMTGIVDQPKGVVISGNTINDLQNIHANSDDAYGIVVGGADHIITNNTITNTEISIQLQKGNDNYNNNNNSNQANLDYYFSRDNSADVCAYLNGNTITTSGAPRLVTGVATASATMPNLVYNSSTQMAFCTIQDAIDNRFTVNSNVINVSAGTFTEEIFLYKSLSLRGANYGINPNTGSRITETIIHPSTSGPDPSDNSAVVTIYMDNNGSGSTIDGFTFDGDNPLLTSGTLINEGTTDVDAIEAISAYEGLSNVNVTNNIIKNYSYAGIDWYNYYNSGAATTGNNIANNLFQGIRPSNAYGMGVLLYNNCYTTVDNNVMNGVRIGVQTGNFYNADPGNSHTISYNNIKSVRLGVWYNSSYGTASEYEIWRNTISSFTGATNNTGIKITSVEGDRYVVVDENYISNVRYGYHVWNNPTTENISLSRGTVIDAIKGVVADNYEGYSANASSSTYNIVGVKIKKCDTGVAVIDNIENTNNATVTMRFGNSTKIDSSNVASIVIDGGDAYGVVSTDDFQTLQLSGKIINNSGNPINATDGDIYLFGEHKITIAGGATIRKLFMDNSDEFEIATGAGNTINILSSIAPWNGVITTNNNLILKSTASSTASINEGNVTGNYINGNITQERYIPAKSSRKWTLLSSPITQTFADSWQQQIHITGAGSGGTICPTLTPHTNGFDATLNNAPSAYTYDASYPSGSRWRAVTNTISTNVGQGVGYRMSIRGNRSLGCSLLDGTPSGLIPTEVTLKSVGTVSLANKNAGNFSITYNNAKTNNSMDKYVMIGNPYPSAINFNRLGTNNNTKIATDHYAIYIPGNTPGIYTYWDDNAFEYSGGNPLLYAGLYGDAIANGQAVFVESILVNDDFLTIDFKETQKQFADDYNGFFRTPRVFKEKIKIGLVQDNNKVDEVVIRYANDAGVSNTEVGKLDIKSMNSGTYISSLKEAKGMAVQTRSLKTLSNDEVWLNIGATASGTYQLNFSEFENFAGTDIYLIDHYTNTTQNIKQNDKYAFSVDKDNVATKGSTRFSVVFNRIIEPVYTSNMIKMYPNPANKQVTFELPQTADNTITYSIKVTDIAGKVVVQQKVNGGTQQLSVDKLVLGTYIVEVIDSKGNRTTEKLIKN